MQSDYVRTQAFCLQKKRMGQQSAHLDLFCPDLGKIRFYQKGFYQPKSLYPAQFDLGHELDLLLVRQDNTWKIQEAGVKKIHSLESYESLTLASFILELLLKMETDYADHAQSLFLMLQKIFTDLSSAQTSFNTLLYFQYQLLVKAGLASNEIYCERCGNEIPPSEPACGISGEWAFLCSSCLQKTAAGNPFYLLPRHRLILENWEDEQALEKGLSRFFNRTEVTGVQNFLNRIYQGDFMLKTLAPFMDLLQQKLSEKA